MKRTSLFAVLCVLGLLMLPQAGMAKLVALSEDQLSEVTGQAGIGIDVTHLDIDTHLDTLTTLGGILTLSDVTIMGAIDYKVPLTTNIVSGVTTPVGAMAGIGMMGLGMVGLVNHAVDMAIDIDRYTIGAIRIGPDPLGPSLGSIGIYGLHADIRGTVSITAH